MLKLKSNTSARFMKGELSLEVSRLALIWLLVNEE